MNARGSLAVTAGLILLTLATYWPVTGHDFVNFDDNAYVFENPAVRSGLNLSGVSWAFTTVGHAANWHPVTWISHMLDAQVFGLAAGGHHLTSILLHAANTVLIFLVLSRCTQAPWASAWTAALFAVHPLHVESVAWISERKDTLSTFFWFLTIGAYLWYVRKPGWWRYVTVITAFAFGLMSKPMTVTLPFILLLLDWWPLSRPFHPIQAPSSRLATITPRGGAVFLVLEKTPLVLLAATSSVITWRAQEAGLAFVKQDPVSLWLKVSNAVVSYAKYLSLTVFPVNLSYFYPFPERGLPAGLVAGSALFLVAVTVAALRLRQSSPWLGVGWLWYLGTLAPVIGVVRVGDHAMADRYTYIPLIGIFMAAAWGLPRIFPEGRRPKRSLLALAALTAVLTLAAAARVQAGYWKDSHTLFTRALQVKPDNWLAHYSLGVFEAKQGSMSAAAGHFAEALKHKPEDNEVRRNLALSLYLSGRIDDSLPLFAEVVRRRPTDEDARFNYGKALESAGRLRDAVSQFEEVVRLRPANEAARLHLERIIRSGAPARHFEDTALRSRSGSVP